MANDQNEASSSSPTPTDTNEKEESDVIEVNSVSEGANSHMYTNFSPQGVGEPVELSSKPWYTFLTGITSSRITTATARSAIRPTERAVLPNSRFSLRRKSQIQLTANMPAITRPYELVRHSSIMLSTSGHGLLSRFFQLIPTRNMAESISAYGRAVTPYW